MYNKNVDIFTLIKNGELLFLVLEKLREIIYYTTMKSCINIHNKITFKILLISFLFLVKLIYAWSATFLTYMYNNNVVTHLVPDHQL